MKLTRFMSICWGCTSVGRTKKSPKNPRTRQGSSRCRNERRPRISRANAMCLRRPNSPITLVSCNDSPQKSLVSSFLIPTLKLCASREDIHWQADPRGVEPHRADEDRDRLHCLPPFRPGAGYALGSPSYQGWRQTFEPLVHPESLLDASSESVHRGPVDFDCARLEGVRGSPRDPVGPVAKDAAHSGVGRHVAGIEAGRKKARMKRVIEGVVFIAIATLLVGAVLWCIPK